MEKVSLYFGDRDYLHLFNLSNLKNKCSIYISDFSFKHEGTDYYVHLINKGDHGQRYKITMNNGETHITDNVWFRDCRGVRKGQITKVGNDHEITLSDFGLLPKHSQRLAIEAVLQEVRKDKEEQKEYDDFWDTRKKLFTIVENSDTYMYAAVKHTMNELETEYDIFVGNSNIFCWMHKSPAYEDDYDKTLYSYIETLNDGHHHIHELIRDGGLLPIFVNCYNKKTYDFFKKKCSHNVRVLLSSDHLEE